MENFSKGRIVTILLAASFASTIGGLPFNALPILLGTLADTFRLGSQQTGLLGSSCFAGYLAGTLAAALFIDMLNWRWLTLGCAVGAATALLVSTRLPIQGQYPIWAAVGFFAALMTCLGMRIIGELPNKERALGVRQGIELSTTAAVLFALPPLFIAPFGYSGAATALAGVILLLSLSGMRLPNHGDMPSASPEEQAKRHPPARLAFAALVILFIFLTGEIGLWAFLERIGNSIPLAPAELGTVFAVLKLLGGAAALGAAAIGSRLGFLVPHLLALGMISLGLVLLATAQGFLPYALGAWVWEVGLTFSCIFQTAAIARFDVSGRSIMLVPTAFALSSMLGPGMAGFLVGGGFATLLWLALFCAFVPTLTYGILFAKHLQTQNAGSILP
ncbi:MAG: MFS transporter [Betaproteobacteria bacterium]|nr:MFS transporter [Betaproteobacteria bacterium]